jgi:SAM-dependent methyltransferase
MRRQAEAIQSLFNHPAFAPQGARLLDFGCGTRPYEPWFTAAGAKYFAADIDGTHDVMVRENGSLAAADASFEIVVSFQVLEHVWDVNTYLGETHRVLKAGGRLLLSTHGSWFYHPHPGDYRRWTAEGLRREVEERGFRLLEMRPVVGPLAWTSILRSYGFAYATQRLSHVGHALAAAATLLYNLRAWLEDLITSKSITANNACVYVALFERV